MSDALINGPAGAGGGIMAQLITYPLQTVNTRQRTERDLKKEKRKLGTIEQLCQVVKQKGWERFYGGLMPSLVGTAASQTHSKISKKSISQSNEPLSPAPDETVLSVVEPISYGTSHVIQEVYDEAEFRGFWKGVLPTLIMGALAELGATVVTYPLLVVKSRLQAKQVTTGDKSHHSKGTSNAILKMIRYEGFSGFYEGMSTKIVQSVLAAAVLFMVKEELERGARFLLSPSTVKSKPR